MKKIYLLLVALMTCFAAGAYTYNIKFKNTGNWSGTIKVYVYNGGQNNGWPGKGMVYNNDKGVWETTLETTYEPEKIIFTNKNENGDQTGDLDFHKESGTYDKDGNFTADPIYTIYFDNSVTKWNIVQFKYWPKTGMPEYGYAMTRIGDSDIWEYTIYDDPTALEGFLFCNGSWGDANQTPNHVGAAVNNSVYKPTSNSMSGATLEDKGDYANYNPDPTPGPDPVDPDVLTMQTPSVDDMLEAYYVEGFVKAEEGQYHTVLNVTGSRPEALSWVKFTDDDSKDTDNDEIATATVTHKCTNVSDAFYRVYMEVEVATPAKAKAIAKAHPTYAMRVARTTFMARHAESTGIGEIGVDDNDAPALYYNLQGVRVDNPAAGVFIRVQGDKVTKELFK